MIFGLVIVVLFFIGLGFLGLMFSRSGDIGPRIAQGGWVPWG